MARLPRKYRFLFSQVPAGQRTRKIRQLMANAGGSTPTPAPVFTSQPTISGISQVGQTLTAVDGIAAFAYGVTRQWYLDGAEAGTAQTLNLAAGDLGKVPGLRNFASGPGGGPVQSSLTTAATVIAAGSGATAPGQPTNVVATAGDGSASATWTAAPSNGAAVDNHRIRFGGGSPVETGSASLSGVISGLINGEAGALEIAAHNAIGWGPWSAASNSVTPSASVPALRASAPFDAVFSGAQASGNTSTGRINCGNVTVGTPTGDDWSIFLQTDHRTTSAGLGGGLLSIGVQSNALTTAVGSLALWYNGSGTSGATPNNGWLNGDYAGTMQVSAVDDEGNVATSRRPVTTFGPANVVPFPLTGRAGVVQHAGSKSHGLLIKNTSGVLSFWDVHPVNGAFLMEEGPGLTSAKNDNVSGAWKGIADKPMFLGFLNHVSQVPKTYWGGPIAQIVLWNGGAMTSEQAVMLAQGVDARDVLSFDGARGDRYWPGNETAAGSGLLEELIAGQHGTVEGTGITFPATTRVQTVDASCTLEWRDNVTFRAAPAPATTSTMRAWGSRRGDVSAVQVRLCAITAAYPALETDVVVPWTDMTFTTAGRWQGDLPGVPHAAGVRFFAETRVRRANGNWEPERRLQGGVGVGDGALMMGQSIMQYFMDKAGGSYALNAGSVGKIHTYDEMMPVGTLNRVNSNNVSGWQSRGAASYTNKWGQTVAADLLVQMTGRRAFFLNLAIAGIAISRYNDTGTAWRRVVRALHEARPSHIIFNQGHGDLTMNEAARWAAQDRVLSQLKAAAASAPGGAFTFTYCVIPVGSDWTTVGGLNSMRNHDLTWAETRHAEGEPVKLLTVITDQPNDEDGTHPRVVAYDEGLMAERVANALAFDAGYAPADGVGGRLGNGTWAWAAGVITIDIPITGGTGTYATRDGDMPTGFRIQLGSGNSVLPTTTELRTDSVRLTLDAAEAPTTGVFWTYMSGYPGVSPTPNGNPASTKPTLEESGIRSCLHDVRSTPKVSTRPGMPIVTVPFARTAVAA